MLRGLFALAGLCLALASPAAAGEVADLDAENGFRGAAFGASLDSIEGLELLSSSGARGTRLYVRPADRLALGAASLDGVTYGFIGERLYFVALFSSGRRDTRALLAELQRAYGPGTRLEGEAVEYVWQGDRVALHFREDPATAFGMVGIRSLPMDALARSPGTAPAAPAP